MFSLVAGLEALCNPETEFGVVLFKKKQVRAFLSFGWVFVLDDVWPIFWAFFERFSDIFWGVFSGGFLDDFFYNL